MFTMLAVSFALAAITMSPALWLVASLLLAAVSSGTVAYFHGKHADRQERIAKAAFAGLKAGLADIATGKDPAQAIEDGIRAAAQDFEVEAHVEDHLDVAFSRDQKTA